MNLINDYRYRFDIPLQIFCYTSENKISLIIMIGKTFHVIGRKGQQLMKLQNFWTQNLLLKIMREIRILCVWLELQEDIIS